MIGALRGEVGRTEAGRVEYRAAAPYMTHMLKIDDAAEIPATAAEDRPDHLAKKRACLRCRTPFDSQWAGERICKRCKTHARWSAGV